MFFKMWIAGNLTWDLWVKEHQRTSNIN
jgi:hypothetical protein